MPPKPENWVVYLRSVRNNVDQIKGICQIAQWNAMESANPGLHQLLHEGIATELQAERFVTRPSERRHLTTS